MADDAQGASMKKNKKTGTNGDSSREDFDQFTVLQEGQPNSEEALSANEFQASQNSDSMADAASMGMLGTASSESESESAPVSGAGLSDPSTRRSALSGDGLSEQNTQQPLNETQQTTSSDAVPETGVQPDDIDVQDEGALLSSSGPGGETELGIAVPPPVISDNQGAPAETDGESVAQTGQTNDTSDLLLVEDQPVELAFVPAEDIVPEPVITTLSVRVSHATDNQRDINSEDGFDLLPGTEYGDVQTLSGAEMDIGGVRDSVQIEYVFSDENTVDVTLLSSWNSVKNIEITSDGPANVTVNNFVHADITLGDGGDSVVSVNGAKRGNITTGDGDDHIEINSYTNNAGWSNEVSVSSGGGRDVVELSGDKGITEFDVNTGGDKDVVIIDGDYLQSDVVLGGGRDVFVGGSGDDNVHGGRGRDRLSGGDGDDTLQGGRGRDHLNGGDGDDVLHGGKGRDVLKGGQGDDQLHGGRGNDVLRGGRGDDSLSGGRGDDTLYGGRGNDVMTGGGGQDTFVIRDVDGHTLIKDFGGVGGGGRGEADLLPHHDTIKLAGDGLTAENMLLTYDGSDTVMTFEGVDGFSITLENFDFTDLDNLPANQSFNILFDGQETGTDGYDVFNDHNARQSHIWNKNSVTHLNENDNTVFGKDGSNDVINAMEGNDTVYGGTGDDVLRGQAGNDTLYGDSDIPEDKPHDFNEASDFEAPPSASASGLASGALSMQQSGQVHISMVGSNAGYKNTLGSYTVNENGVIESAEFVFENAKTTAEGSVHTIQADAGQDIGFFLIANGFRKNGGYDDLDLENGEMSFVYDLGGPDERPANIADDGDQISLVLNDHNGTHVLNGDVYHATERGADTSINTDDAVHAKSGIVDDAAGDSSEPALRIGFEDLKNLGDADFNDLIFDVKIDYDPVLMTGGDDVLNGGLGDDILIGGAGNDTLEGGDGLDTAVFAGQAEEYTIQQNDDGSYTVQDTVAGRDGTDNLVSIETMEFSDQSIEMENFSSVFGDDRGWNDIVGSDDISEMSSNNQGNENWMDVIDDSNSESETSQNPDESNDNNPLGDHNIGVDEMPVMNAENDLHTGHEGGL